MTFSPPLGFNPCFDGSVARVDWSIRYVDIFVKFQSLFWWKCSESALPVPGVRVLIMFQSLFWWKCSERTIWSTSCRTRIRTFQSLFWWKCSERRDILTESRRTNMFQSLFWWKCSESHGGIQKEQKVMMFQSLFWWKCSERSHGGRSLVGDALRFNPCFDGSVARVDGDIEMCGDIGFQSLFWWKCSESERFYDTMNATISFQSLFWWKCSERGYALPARYHFPNVSILVLMEV